MIGRLVTLVVVVWLLVGVAATFQRGYFQSDPNNCATVTSIATTVLAGPLNYLGVNPKVTCTVPQPSK